MSHKFLLFVFRVFAVPKKTTTPTEEFMKYEINQWIVMAVYAWLIRNLKRNADLGTVKTS